MPSKKRASKPKPETAEKGRKGASPLNGVVPPVDKQFKPGGPGGPGRPKKLQDLKDLIVETLAEEAGGDSKLTRAQLLIRTMLVKSPSDRIALLEYAFGKVPQPTRDMNADEWREWMLQNGYSESEANAAFSGMVNAAAEATAHRNADAPARANGNRGDAGSEGS